MYIQLIPALGTLFCFELPNLTPNTLKSMVSYARVFRHALGFCSLSAAAARGLPNCLLDLP